MQVERLDEEKKRNHIRGIREMGDVKGSEMDGVEEE